MNGPLKISVLDRTDTQDFEQLKILLKKFTIDTYVRNKPEFSELTWKEEDEVVNAALQDYENQGSLSILTKKDIETLREDIDSQINSAKELIDKKRNRNTETRYYVMKDGDTMVSFHQVQLVKGRDNGRIEGWRSLAYAEPDYRVSGQVINSRGVIQEGKYSKIIYDDIGQWFQDNGVNYERTCTGVNMLKNISSYILGLSFIPFYKNDKTIFLEKFNQQKVLGKTLSKINRMYREHRKGSEHKSKDEILDEIMHTAEFEELTEGQKQGLVQCFFKKEEKGKKGFKDCIGDDKTKLSSMQKATRSTRDNVIEGGSIESIEQNLE